jgi:putative phosphoesterase
MLLGVVSDTHGQREFTRLAVEMLRTLEVECVLHCGDIGSPEIVGMFADWPTHFVFGNVDHDCRALRRAIQQHQQHCHERFGSLEMVGVKIALLHGDDTRLLRETIESQQWDLVCCGHTHQVQQEQVGRTLVLNPGAVYRANPHSIAVVELPAVRATTVVL